jgi:EmrB/QacA subfamily drug resistance transporter
VWREAGDLGNARDVVAGRSLIDESEERPQRSRFRALLVEPRRIPSVRERPNAYWFAVGAVCVGAFMGQLDASIVTIAFPTLQRAFHVHVGAVTWVGISYLVALVAFVTIVGRFADMAGRKLLYVYGFALFALASAGCGLAPDLPALIVLRIVQGVGAAMLQANSLAIINIATPPAKLGRAIGVQGAAQALGLALGPSVGGALIALGGWRLIFYVNVPVGALGVAAGLAFIPRSRHLRARAPLDWAGLLLFVPMICALLIAISFGDSWGWGSATVVTMFVAALVVGAAFFARERAAAEPMVDLALFRRRSFSAGVASGLLGYLVTFGTLLVLPYLLERGLGLSAGTAGLELMVMPLMLGVVAPVAGHVGDRIGVRTLTSVGMVVVSAALFALALSGPSTGAVLGGLALVGVGLGCFTPANNAAVLSTVPREQSGEASGVLNVTRATGTALGLALAGLVYALGSGGHDLRPAVTAGYHDAVLFLSGIALAAAAFSSARPSRAAVR